MSYNSESKRVRNSKSIWNYGHDYSLNCTPLDPNYYYLSIICFLLQFYWLLRRRNLTYIRFKEKVTPESLTLFWFSPVTSKHSAFPLSLWSARYPEENSAAIPCLCDVIPSDSKLAGRRKSAFTRSAKIYFFQAIIHFTIFNAFISEFEPCLAQKSRAQEP